MSDQQEFPEDPSEYADPQSAPQHKPGKGLALPGQNLPDKVYIIPIHNRPFFPAQVLPVIVNEEPWAETLDLVAKSEHHSLALFYMDTPRKIRATSTPRPCRSTAPWSRSTTPAAKTANCNSSPRA